MSAIASAAVVASALFAATVLLRPARRGPATAPAVGRPNGLPSGGSAGGHGRPVAGRADRGASRGPAGDLQRASLLVAQIAALLRAGRSPAQMWAQTAAIHASASGLGPDPGGWTFHGAAPPRSGQGRAGRWRQAGASWEETSAVVLAAAAQAASLGRPVGRAIRAAAGSTARGRAVPSASARSAGIWCSVAACIETAEASGSPLAAVLDRLAAQFEADADAAAARAVALAGPKATAKVLSVLPVAGLGLGMLMGVDPLGLLLSTPLGAGCLALGAILTLVGRWWSTRLVHAASEER